MMISKIFRLRAVVEGGAVRAESDRYAPEGAEAPIVRRRRKSAQGGLALVDLKLQNHQELLQETEMHKQREREEDRWYLPRG